MWNSNPTVYADLNAVLCELAATTRAILADNFCGAYLQGSFAVGDADEHSDVDFVIVTQAEVSAEQEADLRRMHALFPTRDVAWAQHLEGSYFPRSVLRRPGPARRPLLYVDNGSPEMEWSNHDNTAVVRWALREYGIALDGPALSSLVDVVTAEELRDEIRRTLREKALELRAHTDALGGHWSAWLQPHVVLSNCRMLHTLSSGRVGSKRAAGRWALGALDRRWASLIQRALDDRPDPWLRVHRPADRAAIAETWAFVDYALQQAEMIPT
jgi:hypothetical protein